jgi:hypothetical protein
MESAPITNNTDMHEICERYKRLYGAWRLSSLWKNEFHSFA